MGRMIFQKQAIVANPGTDEVEIHFETTAPGVNTPTKLVARDQSGNVAVLAGLATKDYRLIRVVEIEVGTGTFTPTNGAQALLIECIGGGASAGGAPTASSNLSCGGGGGAGAYSMTWLTGALKTSYSYVVGNGGAAGAPGAAGNDGADTTFDSPSICTAKKGNFAGSLAAGTTVNYVQGGNGGNASSGVGDLLMDGSDGGAGTRLSATIGIGGYGGNAPLGGGAAKASVGTGPGNSGKKYGGGGSGAMTIGVAQAGGAGADGVIRIWEFA